MQGKFSEAEVLHKRLHAILEGNFDAEHPTVAELLNDRAMLLESQV